MTVSGCDFICLMDRFALFLLKFLIQIERGGRMIVSDEQQVPAVAIANPEVHNAAIKVLISEKEGWADYVLRIIELGPDGHTPHHRHPWPHINYIVEGTGTLFMDGQEHPVQAGGYAYVAAGAEHQYKNAGQGMFRFICIVPKEGHQ
jgi:quercetin dioxygenase-like cupin family protein